MPGGRRPSRLSSIRLPNLRRRLTPELDERRDRDRGGAGGFRGGPPLRTA
jgi:hypothetical protein